MDSTNLEWTRNTVRDISVKNSIYEQIENFDTNNAPALDCHFAGSSEGQNSWIKLNLEDNDLEKQV